MPRPSKAIPSYLHHKASGRAYCIIRKADGSKEQIYLGEYGSQESREAYARVLAGHTIAPAVSGSNTPQGGLPSPSSDGKSSRVAPAGPLTVAELILRFITHAETYYRRADGTATREPGEFKMALRPARHLFGELPATEFGPRCLKAVRQLMVDGYANPDHGEQASVCRGVANQRTARIVRVFRWAVSEELLPVTVAQALATVPGLKAGRSDARETEPVLPVAWDAVEATLSHLNPVVRAMVLFMWHTGCRPGEACTIKAGEIDRTGEAWLYTPAYHKLAYRGRPRTVAIGKRGQEALAPFLGREGFLFSPAQAVEILNAEKRAKRKTKVQPSQVSRAKKKPKRSPGLFYRPVQLNRAIRRACEAAGIEPWHANQLRHSFATRVRAAYGIEGAQVVLGHSNANVSQVYALRDQTLAAKVAADLG